ncbi:MAG: hypothetical protein LC745_07110, partial [Planctomycetia bacterium]|nr:hypothetical protein [Planctomycetia bacterium]
MPSRAWFGIILVATASVAARPVRGQDGPGAVPPDAPARAREPIDLAARRVRFWQDGGDQWVLLSDQAAVLQGTEGVRAQEIIVRVKEVQTAGGLAYRLDAYAEGVVPLPGRPARVSGRSTFQTDQAPRLNAYEASGLVRADGPPSNSATLARSGFLQNATPSVPSRPARQPTPVPTVAFQKAPSAGSGVEAAPKTPGDTPHRVVPSDPPAAGHDPE